MSEEYRDFVNYINNTIVNMGISYEIYSYKYRIGYPVDFAIAKVINGNRKTIATGFRSVDHAKAWLDSLRDSRHQRLH